MSVTNISKMQLFILISTIPHIIGEVRDCQTPGRVHSLWVKQESLINRMIEESKFTAEQEIADTLKVDRGTVLQKMHEMGLKYSFPQGIPYRILIISLNLRSKSKKANYMSRTAQTKKNAQDKKINIIFTNESSSQIYPNKQIIGTLKTIIISQVFLS